MFLLHSIEQLGSFPAHILMLNEQYGFGNLEDMVACVLLCVRRDTIQSVWRNLSETPYNVLYISENHICHCE